MAEQGYFVEYYTRCRRESIYRLCNYPYKKPSLKYISKSSLYLALHRYFEQNENGYYDLTPEGRTVFQQHIRQVDQEQIKQRGKNRSLLLIE
jgi:hypothetical protein